MLKRRKKRRKNHTMANQTLILVSVITILFITVGYSAFSKQLYMNGGARIGDSNVNKTYQIGDEVYFDPMLGLRCDQSDAWTMENKNTTCYKWNIINDQEEMVEMMVDHNLGNTVAWDSTNQASTGPKEVLDELKEVTRDFKNVILYTSADNKTISAPNGDSYTIDYNEYKGRLIGMDEIVLFDHTENWTGHGDFLTINTPWLYQNLITDTGYWTDTAMYSNSLSNIGAWTILLSQFPTFHSAYVDNIIAYSVRPVIRVYKKYL